MIKGSPILQDVSPRPAFQQPFIFLPRSGIVPSIVEYTRLHMMNVGWTSAQRCIDSFDGCALLAPMETFQNPDVDCASYDYNRLYWPRFDVIGYYALCVVSLTGIFTFLGMTKLLVCRAESQEINVGNDNSSTISSSGSDEPIIRSESYDKKLYIPRKVADYILERSKELARNEKVQIIELDDNGNEPAPDSDREEPRLRLQRRFEIQFASNYASVVMLHVVCSNGYKHLVEVYECNSWYGQFMTKIIVTFQEWIAKERRRLPMDKSQPKINSTTTDNIDSEKMP